MKHLARLVVLLACVSTAPELHAVRPQYSGPSGWHLGGRYDDSRVVMMMGAVNTTTAGHAVEMTQPAAHALPAFPATRAELFGPVNELDAARAETIVHNAVHIGDHWVLDAGRFGWFHLTVERFIVGDWQCEVQWGVMASVAPEEQPAFAKVTEKYFALTPAVGFVPPDRPTAVGPLAFSPSPEQRATLERLVNAEFVRQWPEVHAETLRAYAGLDGRRAWPDAWAAIDRRIAIGEATPTYDVQAFRMTPDGEPRLFVRASWTVGSQVVFLLTAWARVGSSLTLDHVDVNGSRRRSYAEFPSRANLAELAGMILTVLDVDRTGWGEFTIMHRDSANDAMSIDVFEYPRTPTGEPRLVINVNLSC